MGHVASALLDRLPHERTERNRRQHRLATRHPDYGRLPEPPYRPQRG